MLSMRSIGFDYLHNLDIKSDYDEDEHMWLYQDPSGNQHGEYTDDQMLGWYEQGVYFNSSLLLMRKCDDKYRTLAEYENIFGRVPFAAGDRVPPLAPYDPSFVVNELEENGTLEHSNSYLHHMTKKQDEFSTSTAEHIMKMLGDLNLKQSNLSSSSSSYLHHSSHDQFNNHKILGGHETMHAFETEFAATWHTENFYSNKPLSYNQTAALANLRNGRDSELSSAFLHHKLADRSKVSDNDSCANSSSSKQSFNPTYMLIYGLQSRDNCSSIGSRTASTPIRDLETLFGTDDPVELARAFNSSPEFFAAPPLEGLPPLHRPPPPLPNLTLDSNSPVAPKPAPEDRSKPALSLDSRAPGYRAPPKTESKKVDGAAATAEKPENGRESAKKQLGELIQWVNAALVNVQVKEIDIPTAVEVLADIDSPYEVEAMFYSYLGDSPRIQQFVREFLDRRRPYWQLQKQMQSKEAHKKKKKAAAATDPDGLDCPAPASLSLMTSKNNSSSNRDSSPDLMSNADDSSNSNGQWKHIKTKKSKSNRKAGAAPGSKHQQPQQQKFVRS